MTQTAGIDVGSTYTKAIVLDDESKIVGRSLVRTGFRLPEAAREAFDLALDDARLSADDVAYVASTGFGRFQVDFRQLNVTDLTAASWGSRHLFPKTRTVLDVGGQTMKATQIDESCRVKSFRLNDKCAAGTGAFLEKTAHYLGYDIEEIGPLAAESEETVPISGVCAVFAESEVINHLSQGTSPEAIMHGSILSLVKRSIQLMKRVGVRSEVTLVGGILRFDTMVFEIRQNLDGAEVNVPDEDLAQFVPALGAAVLARRRAEKAPESMLTASVGESSEA